MARDGSDEAEGGRVRRVVDEQALVGSWVHAHEQDGTDRQVFVPADRALPPSRGRSGFTLRADHRATIGLPGPDDSGATDDGTWQVDGELLEVRSPTWTLRYQVLAAGPDRLEIRPVPDPTRRPDVRDQ
jgi:hypothetical protein